MHDFFSKRANQFEKKYLKHKRNSNMLSFFRGVAFILTVALLIQFLSTDDTSLLWVSTLPLFGFFVLVHYHKKEEFRTDLFLNLSKLNKQEINRLELRLDDFEPGERYKDELHAYSEDLDIFGQNSLYQLLNRCQIEDSKDLLASWLLNRAEPREITGRQKAVRELSKDPDLTQKFQAVSKIEVGKRKKSDPNIQQKDIEQWITKNIRFAKKQLWLILTCVLITIMLGSVGLYYFRGFSYHIFYLPLVLNGIFLTVSIKYLHELAKGIDKSYFLISTYKKAIDLIQNQRFESNYLVSIREDLKKDHAYEAISKLASLTHRLSSRANLLYGLLDIIFLLDAILLIDLYRWRVTHRDHISKWFQAVNKMECLISLAGFAQANPQFSLPTIKNDSFQFEAKNMGHPLIRSHEKVRNDYQIDGSGHVDIITGSNMSGKSTFQRTVGINMVLAQMGAPVDATNLEMSPTHVFTSMRTKDNLAEHTSSFYAELKRIHQLLLEIEKNQTTFFLLDEILKGTNSEDRHTGALALTRKLTTKRAFGMISTHDLALGELEKTEKTIRNFSFNSTIKKNEIIFDYKLTPGLCKSFNASKLMEKMGIM